MFRLLITTMNCGVPVGSIIERFDTLQEQQHAERQLDRANDQYRKDHGWATHDLYRYAEL